MRRLLAALALLAAGIVAADEPESLTPGDVASVMRACRDGCAVLTTADADRLQADIAAMRAVVRRLVREQEEAQKAEAARRCS